MKSAVRPPRPSSISQKSDDATRQRALALALDEQVAENGDERGRERRVGHERPHRVRDQEGDLEGVDRAADAEDRRLRDLPHEPDDPREPGRDREDDARAREASRRISSPAPPRASGATVGTATCAASPSSSSACASSSISSPRSRRRTEDRRRPLGRVLRDRPAVERRVALEVRRLALLAAAAVALQPPLLPLPLGVLHEGSIGRGVATIARPASCGSFSEMPNIKQQEKRVRQAARQRQENLRWRSTAKTLMRRLDEAVADGDAKETEARHRELVQLARPRRGERRPPPEHRRSAQVSGREARRRHSREVSALSRCERRAGG